MIKLNKQQLAAIRHSETPLLVLAGAGSGKTSVIANKIVHLITKKDAEARQITAITFTNRAANEMRERVMGLIANKGFNGPTISTFHSLGLKILRAESDSLGYRSNFSIYDTNDCQDLLADIMRKYKIPDSISVSQVQVQISDWKSSFIHSAQKSQHQFSLLQNKIWPVYTEYQETLLAYNAVDFDDLVVAPVRLFLSNENCLKRWQNKISYLMVDEYQDTNQAQYELVKLLAAEHGRLTVVGDDDQSIYGWRGAKPENISQLQKDYPSLKVIKLEQNYRSTGIILKSANSLIKNNSHKYEKVLWSDNGFGSPIKILPSSNEFEEVEKIVNDILYAQLLQPQSYDSFAVLIRSNYQAKLFEKAFIEKNIPYQLSGGQSFFDYTEIKDCLCYLRLLVNTDDNNALLRIINTPRRGIGAQSIKKLIDMAQIENLSLYEATRCARFNEFFPDTAGNRIRKFSDWLFEFEKKFISYEPEKIIQKLLDDISFDDWLDTIAPDEKQRERKKNNIRELLSWIKKISEKNPGYELIDVVSSLMLFDVLDRRENEGKADSVSLTTLHAAKGLEFPHVYIAGFEEGILPHHASTDDASIEEERRIAYVGITRAMKTLTLTYCNTRKRYGQVEICEPSRFLDELPQSEIEWERNGSEQKSSQKTGLDTLEKLRSRLAHTAAPDLE